MYLFSIEESFCHIFQVFILLQKSNHHHQIYQKINLFFIAVILFVLF